MVFDHEIQENSVPLPSVSTPTISPIQFKIVRYDATVFTGRMLHLSQLSPTDVPSTLRAVTAQLPESFSDVSARSCELLLWFTRGRRTFALLYRHESMRTLLFIRRRSTNGIPLNFQDSAGRYQLDIRQPNISHRVECSPKTLLGQWSFVDHTAIGLHAANTLRDNDFSATSAMSYFEKRFAPASTIAIGSSNQFLLRGSAISDCRVWSIIAFYQQRMVRAGLWVYKTYLLSDMALLAFDPRNGATWISIRAMSYDALDMVSRASPAAPTEVMKAIITMHYTKSTP